MIKRDYLSFHQVFEQRVQFRSHQRRVAKARGSSYNNQEQTKLLEGIVEFQQKMKKRNHEIWEREIQDRNEHLFQRLQEIKRTEPKIQVKDLINFSSKKGIQQELNNQVKRENLMLKERLKSIESQINNKSLNLEYQKHKNILERMQRFKKRNEKSVLKSLEQIEYSEQIAKQRQLRVHTQSVRTEPDKEDGLSRLFSIRQQILYN